MSNLSREDVPVIKVRGRPKVRDELKLKTYSIQLRIVKMEELKALAEKDEATVASLIRKAVSLYLKKRKAKQKTIKVRA